jgi:hypothetical protein
MSDAIAAAERIQAAMIAATPAFPRYGYYVKTGLAGYGPDLDENDYPAMSWESLASEVASELSAMADFAMEGAYLAGDVEGDYQRAWQEFKRSESLAMLAAELDSERANAPLYTGRPELWHATIYSIVSARFPLDVSDNTRLYVWECSTEDPGEEDE